MSTTLLTGTLVVQLALICYSIGVISEQRSHQVTRRVLGFLIFGVVFDIAATILMIAGSPNSPFTLHGFVGYSSLLGMLIETSLAWRHRSQNGDAKVSQALHVYSCSAYIWWVMAYVTGAILVMLKR